MIKRKSNYLISKIITSIITLSLILPNCVNPVFATQTTLLNIEATATNIDFTVPSNLTISLNPNSKISNERFQYGNLKVMNNSVSGIDIFIDSFTDKNSTFANNVSPDGLPNGKTWETLTATETNKYFALGLNIDDTWQSKKIADYLYCSSFTERTKIGTIASQGEGNILLNSYFGNAFKTSKNFEYEIVFSAELQDEELASGYTIDEEATSPLNYELTDGLGASGNGVIETFEDIFGLQTVSAAPKEVFEVPTVISGTAKITGLKDNSVSSLYIADYYETTDGKIYEITGMKAGEYGSSTIAGANLTSVEIGKNLTEIPDYAFCQNKNLTSITISEGVQKIGLMAFEDCSNLTSFNLPSSLITIGEQAFTGCYNLTGELVIPEGVQNIGNFAFTGCKKLTGDIIIPEGIVNIGKRTFADTGIETITIPEGVQNIGEEAFAECKGLTGTLTLPSTLTSIGNGAFSKCSGLTEITIPEGVQNIGNEAFAGCSGLTGTLTLPSTLTTIGYRAFTNCSGLTEIIIPNSISSIDFGTFQYCNFTEITIPNSVSSIYSDAFEYCFKLTTIHYSGSATGAPWGSSATVMP